MRPPDRVAGPGPARAGRFAGLGIQARLSLLFATCAVLAGAALLLVQRNQIRQLDLLVSERRVEAREVFEQIVSLQARGARVHAADYSRWDEMIAFADRPDPAWERTYLTESLPTFDLDMAYVLDRNGRLASNARVDGALDMGATPIPLEALRKVLAKRPAQHFFVHTPNGLLEAWANSIVPSADIEHITRPQGYYVVGRLWTPERIVALAQLTRGRLTLLPPGPLDGARDTAANENAISVTMSLPGLDGAPVARLHQDLPFAIASRVRELMWATLGGLLAAVLLALLIAAAALSRWVSRPLRAISGALTQNDPRTLGATLHRQDELGHLAGLVQRSFAQTRELELARDAAESAVQAKSQFLANISHELRTPLHGILSFARFGVRDAGTAPAAEIQDNFEQIQECGNSLLTLLNDLLDLSKFEAGRMRLSLEPVDLTETLDELADQYRSLLSERRLSVEQDIEPDLPAVMGDRTRLLQVVRNLVSNSAKFTPEGGMIRLRAQRVDDRVRVAVEDTGVGIPADELEKIFDKFVQASHTTSRTGGTGLGLAICQEIARIHGGRIWAENRAEGGARVQFEIPIAGPAQGMSATTDEHSDEHSPDSAGRAA
ncbi:MAG: ATP-binding protein [Candidatus Eisenbacteria bacterium]